MPNQLCDIKSMLKLKIIILLTLIFTSCKKASKSFDEIHILTETDSSYIELIVTNDSIIILQLLDDKDISAWEPTFSKKYYAEIIKSKQIFKSIYKETQYVLEDTFKLEYFTIVDGVDKSSLIFLFQDSLIKELRYFRFQSNCNEILQIELKLFNLIRNSSRIHLNTSEKLIDVSDLKYVDSIRINKLKTYDFDDYGRKRVNWAVDYKVKMITRKSQIDTFRNCILNQTLLADNTGIKEFGKFIPIYRFDFFRKGLIRFQLETDLKTIPYSWLQTLKVDSNIIKQIY